jgi:D-alanyl-D-alanine dipeptidase
MKTSAESHDIVKMQGSLALESIRESVRALIRPTAFDYFRVGQQAQIGQRAEALRITQQLLEIRDKGRAAATRLSVLARDPNAATVDRYDEQVRKHRRGK